MKQVTQLIRQSALHRLGALAMIAGVISWGLGLSPGQALAGFSQNDFGEQDVFVQVSPISPIETPTEPPTTPPATDTPVVTSTATSVPLPTHTPNSTLTPSPVPGSINLTLDGPAAVTPGQTFDVSVLAQGVTAPGLYGAQFEINYNPALFSVSNLQANADLAFVLLNSADNTTGKIRFVAARQGDVSELTGNVTLLTFTATAANTTGSATFAFTNYKLGSAQALVLNATAQDYSVTIQDTATPIPTSPSTPQPTNTPMPTTTPLPLPTNTPVPGPTNTPVPTNTPLPNPTTTPSPAPTQTPAPTPQPNTATVSGQIILTGRANNDWSGGGAVIADSRQFASTDANGNFNIANVTPGLHAAIAADAPGYLPAVCLAPVVVTPKTTLTKIALLSGDVNDDIKVDIHDATAIGVVFGQTGPDLKADINRDQQVDVLDLILVTLNFGKGPQVWRCLE